MYIFWIVHANTLPICVQMSSDSDSDDETEMIVRHHAHALNVIYIGVANIAALYCDTYLDKANPRTSILSRMGWLREILIGNPERNL